MSDATATVRYTLAPRAVFAGLRGGEGVLVDTETAFYFGLNRTATFLWSRLVDAREATAADLTRALVDQFEVEASTAETDVDGFLHRVIELGLATQQHS